MTEESDNLLLFKLFVPNELLHVFDEKKQFSADFKRTKAAIYGGSYEEFMKDLYLFTFNVDSRVKPGSKDKEFEDIPITFKRGETTFAYKRDLCQFLTWRRCGKKQLEMSDHIIRTVFELFWKSMESRLKESFELCEFSMEDITSISNLMKENENNVERKYQIKDQTLGEVFIHLKNMIPVPHDEALMANLERTLSEDVRRCAVKKRIKYYQNILNYASSSIKVMQKFHADRPLLFLPRPPLHPEWHSVYLRVFEENGSKFMLVQEVLQMIKAERWDVKELEEKLRRIIRVEFPIKKGYSTVNYETVYSKLQHLENIEFVPITPRRTKTRALLIPAFSGMYCMLTSDLLIEILRFVISVRSIFQKMTNERWRVFKEVFWKCVCDDDHFKICKKVPQFTKVEEVYVIRDHLGKFFCIFYPEWFANAVEIRPVDGNFSLEDLKSELKHLRVTNFFTNIEEHAEVAYNLVVKNKKKEKLRTCDMYDAVEHCQMIALLKLLPNRHRWLHNQHACYRLPVECPWCPKPDQ
ncbi:hypothetical protein CRE_09216 [Caenorhabditis remanei]|uniref:DUF7809 domain-containing protein n=1 Tax=Caenorhabditis remanei TaxID=31234 RepID=E3LHK2_CAERE|nr:hypothetical protein CRE_09216 [Caenorhabditis remanei]